MDKRIDILRKYPNCKVRHEGLGVCKINAVFYDYEKDDGVIACLTPLHFPEKNFDWFVDDDAKPILRPMSTMTEKERKRLNGIFDTIRPTCFTETERGITIPNPLFIERSAELTDYLRSISIDIDGLIESKQAEEQQ